MYLKFILVSSKGIDYDKMSGYIGEEIGNIELISYLDEFRGGRLVGGVFGFVDFR